MADPTIARLWSLIRQLQGMLDGMLDGRRIISGGLTNAGAVNYGTGFTSSRTGVGTYVVTFTRPFTTSFATILGSDQGVALSESFWSAQSGSGFTFNVRNGAAVAVDAFVNFHCIG